MSSIEELVAATRREVEERRAQVPIHDLMRSIESRPQGRPFSEALAKPGMSLVAEYKRHTASGDLPRGADPVATIVKSYERGGASAISVLTRREHFQGSLIDLREAREASTLPVLRKDFIIDEYQLFEAAHAGADAVLLMVDVVELRELEILYQRAEEMDLDCLVEVHNEEQLQTALEIDADVIGINNRQFPNGTFTSSTDIGRTLELLPAIPAGKTVISQSGIKSSQDVDELEAAGIDAVLVGTLLMSSDDPEGTCRQLIGGAQSTDA